VRAALIAAGVLVMGYAVVSALADPDVPPAGVVAFLAAVLVGHDAVLLPLVLAAGALIGRYVPSGARVAVRVAALCSLAVTVVAVPLIVVSGRRYGYGLAAVLLVIWMVAAVAAPAARRIRKGLERPTEGRGSGSGG
jgi:hypothetical protein